MCWPGESLGRTGHLQASNSTGELLPGRQACTDTENNLLWPLPPPFLHYSLGEGGEGPQWRRRTLSKEKENEKQKLYFAQKEGREGPVS